MADDPKGFLLEHMADSERGQGRIPKARRNDEVAQQILADVDSRPAPKERERPVRADSPHVDGVDVKTYSREETERMREERRRKRADLMRNQELFLKHRAINYLRQFPECQHYFDRIKHWKADRLLAASTPDQVAEAKTRGTVEAAKVIDEMLEEYRRRTGRPWYFIRKGGKWINPRPACR